MLYTRKGDGGDTGLFGTKERFSKEHQVFEALGSVDELNSFVGLVRAHLCEQGHMEVSGDLYRIQETLFIVQGELAGATTRITPAHVDALEAAIEQIERRIEKPTSFLIPGATTASAFLDCARTIARRAERAVLRARANRELSHELRAYLNRLSSYFYACARNAAQTAGTVEQPPTYAPTRNQPTL